MSRTPLRFEDYSQLKRLFDRWRAEAVIGLRPTSSKTQRLRQCCTSLRVLQAKSRTLARVLTGSLLIL